MTAYSESVFNSVAGHVQQIALAAILQQEANRDYVPDPLATDFTRNAVSWQLVTDTAQANIKSDQYGYLEISVTMPLLNDSPLLNKNDLYQRVGTINNTDIASLSLARESNYVSVGALAPDPANPNSVPGGTYPGTSSDTLERRLAWLLSTLLAKYAYVKRWNYWASQLWAYCDPITVGNIVLGPDQSIKSQFDYFGTDGALYVLRQMGEISPTLADRPSQDYETIFQQLIAAVDDLTYQFTAINPDIDYGTSSSNSSDITSAGGEEDFYDPSGERDSNLQDFDNPALPSGNSAGDGATGNESPDNSLSDC